LAEATPDGLLELIDAGAALAREWRQDFFLGEDTADAGPSPGGPPVALRNLA
jgi:hypothetical protein